MNSTLKFLIILLPISVLGCRESDTNKSEMKKPEKQEIAFDEEKWKSKEGDEFPYRDMMLMDLVNKKEIRDLNKTELLELLGDPSYYSTDSAYLYYRITENKLGFWTLRTKTLVVKISDHNSIDWMKIHE